MKRDDKDAFLGNVAKTDLDFELYDPKNEGPVGSARSLSILQPYG